MTCNNRHLNPGVIDSYKLFADYEPVETTVSIGRGKVVEFKGFKVTYRVAIDSEESKFTGTHEEQYDLDDDFFKSMESMAIKKSKKRKEAMERMAMERMAMERMAMTMTMMV